MSRIVERIFDAEPSDLLPAITADNAEFWSSLERGQLMLQCCEDCERFRYPIVPVCPYCSSSSFRWRQASGKGRIFSWVRYHRSYLPEFEPLMPYCVITAALDEGVRMFGLLKGEGDPEMDRPEMDREVRVVIEKWPNGRCVPAFELVAEVAP